MLVTPRADRAAKRARPRTTITTRTVGTQTDYRAGFTGSKTEMKNRVVSIIHTTSLNSVTRINAITQGSAINQRIGSKVKVLRVEGLIRSTTDKSLRATLYSPKTGSAVSLAPSLDGPVDLNDYWVVKDWWMHNGTSPNGRGAFFSHKFPMGVITEFAIGSTAADADFRKGMLLLRIQATSSDTVQGYVRCWYVDP